MAQASGTIKVVLVDDHDLMRAGISEIISKIDGIEVIGEASSGEDGIALARQLKPNVVLMDVQMPGIGGLEAAARLSRSCPNIAILAVTAFTDDPYPAQMLQAGCKGYLTKGCSKEEMEAAIRTIHAGKRYIMPSIAQQLAMKHVEGKSPLDDLSRRELQVLDMIADEFAKPPEMAETWNISPKTVNSYRYRLYEKLGIESKTDVELVHKARLYRLVKMGVNIVNPEFHLHEDDHKLNRFTAIADERDRLKGKATEESANDVAEPDDE